MFGKAIFDDSFPVTDGEDFVCKLSKKIASELCDYTIYVPCHVAHGCDYPETLNIGNLKLINRLCFEKMTDGLGNGKPEEYETRMWTSVLDRYRNFYWFVEVPVKGVFNLKLARNVASILAQHVINLIHLVISASHSYRMMTGFNIPAELDNHILFKTAAGNFSCLHRGAAKGNVGLPEKFTEIFESGRPKELLDVVSQCINLELDLRNEYPMVRRLLEATYWYGDAVRESNLSVKIVKYTSALERLLVFGETSGYTKILPKRAAALMKNIWVLPDEEIKSNMEIIKKGYDLRSKILHGSISPISPALDFPVHQIDKVCGLTLEAFIYNLESSLRDQRDEKILRDWIKSLVVKFCL